MHYKGNLQVKCYQRLTKLQAGIVLVLLLTVLTMMLSICWAKLGLMDQPLHPVPQPGLPVWR